MVTYSKLEKHWQNHGLSQEKEGKAVLVLDQADGGKKNFQSACEWLQIKICRVQVAVCDSMVLTCS